MRALFRGISEVDQDIDEYSEVSGRAGVEEDAQVLNALGLVGQIVELNERLGELSRDDGERQLFEEEDDEIGDDIKGLSLEDGVLTSVALRTKSLHLCVVQRRQLEDTACLQGRLLS